MWKFDLRGNWQLSHFVKPLFISFVFLFCFLSVNSPAFAKEAIENSSSETITILNPHQEPKAGDIWSVEFQTEGAGVLSIIPGDENTIADLEFVSLTCGDQTITPVTLTNKILFLNNWQCSQKATISHKILKTGNHTLKFQFQDKTTFAYNSAVNWQWAKRLGGTGTDAGISVTVDSNNRVIITSDVTGNADVNGDGDSTDGGAESAIGYGSTDIIISVFNSSGSFQWAKRLGGAGTDTGRGITVDSANNIIVTGYVTGNADVNGDGDSTDGGAEDSTGYGGVDVLISVFNSSGDWQWAKRLGGVGSDSGYSVVTDSNNNIIVAGYVIGNADVNGDGDSTDGGAESATGYGGEDIFISVFNSSGTWQWAKRLGGTGNDRGLGITIDSNNSVIISGNVNGNADVNGDGDSTDGGAESGTGYGNTDTLISVFNSSGTWQWAKRLGGTSYEWGNGITTDSDNNIIVTGQIVGNVDVNGDGDSTDGGAESGTGYGSADILISVFNSSGTWQWAKRLGGTGFDSGRGVIVDSENNIIVTGDITGDVDVNGDGDSTDGGAESGTGYGSADILISVFNSSGTWQWAKRLGGASTDRGFGVITIDSNNNVIVTGLINGNADVNGDGDSNDGGAESGIGYGSDDILISVFNFDEIAPSISLTTLLPDPNSDNTPTLSGTVTDVSATVSSVEYQMDSTSGTWTACSADDGAFDEASEPFTCNVTTALSTGSHTIYVRATDSNSNTTLSGSVTSDSFEISEFSVDLAPNGVSQPNSSDTATLGAKTITSADEVEVRWDRPADTSNIDEYVVHYREIGSSKWKTISVDSGEDSISFDPGEGSWEWYLEIIYTDGSHSETNTYKFEIDQTDPTMPKETISMRDETPGVTLLLPYGSPIVIDIEDPDGDKVIQLWNWERTIHYDTMVCGDGACDHGHLLTGPLTLVIYMEDEVGNLSEEREIKVSPFSATAVYVPVVDTTTNVQGTTIAKDGAPTSVGGVQGAKTQTTKTQTQQKTQEQSQLQTEEIVQKQSMFQRFRNWVKDIVN